MKDEHKTKCLFRRLGAIAVPASIVIIAILAILDIRVVFEPPLLLFILNTLFFSVVGFVVAYIAARGYVTGGPPSLLLLGCGVVALGSGGLAAGRLIGPSGGPNVNVTIFNTGALLGATFHIVGAILTSAGVTSEKVTKRRKSTVMLAYLGVLVFTALLTMASLQGAIPPFFVQGVGPTLLRQVVLGTATALFAMSSLHFMIFYSKSRSEFLYWYSLALALIAVGLSAVFLQKAVGSPIGWAGRSAQYLGGIYFLIAVLTALRGARAKGIPLEKAIADFLRQAEEHYRALVETVPDAIISCDHEGRVLLWNSAAERMFGYSRGEAVGSLLIDLIAPDRHADNLRQEMEKFAKTGKGPLIGKATEIEAKRKNGEVFPVELSVSARKAADGWVSTIIVRDITERKRAEEALRGSGERFRSLFDNASVGMALVDQGGYVLVANEADRRFLGYSQEEIVGMHFTEFTHPEDLDTDLDLYNALARGEINSYVIDKRYVRKDGEVVWGRLGVSLIRDDGQPQYSVIVCEDITERVRAEEELQQSYVNLQRALEGTVHVLVSAIEMRDPYTAGHQRRVTQLACAIANEMGLSEGQTEGIRMAGLIHDLGKITVPADILSKPSPLSALEWGLIKAHSQVGYDILKTVDFPWPVAEIVLQHHERLDGSGYPQGLSGEGIILEARILGVADVVEAMASHRPYRSARGIDKALEEISQNKGILYDPEVVDVCLRLFTEDGFEFE